MPELEKGDDDRTERVPKTVEALAATEARMLVPTREEDAEGAVG